MVKQQITKEQLLGQDPTVIANNPDGSRFIPIENLEYDLDVFDWQTENFKWEVFKDGYANLCVAASIELLLNFSDDPSFSDPRRFVGACNFSIKSLEANTHFLATAKSECIKNAASEAGKKLGRGINIDITPFQVREEKKVVRSKPDSKIMQQFLDAVAKDDQAAIIMLTNIYDIKTD